MGAKDTFSFVIRDLAEELIRDKSSDYAVDNLVEHGVSSAFSRVLFTGVEMYCGKVNGVSGANKIEDVSDVMCVRKVVDEAGEGAVKKVVREGAAEATKKVSTNYKDIAKDKIELTKENFLNKAKEIDGKFGDKFNPKIK